MRIENTPLPQSLIESQKPIEKKEVTTDSNGNILSDDDSQSVIPTPLGSSGTYSVASLKSAVDYYAKFLTVAESNIQAANHSAAIPQSLIDRLNGR
jgi:hypothetical protein